MPLSILFWIIMVLFLILGFWTGRGAEGHYDWPRSGNWLVILGWALFGSIVK